MAFFNSVSLDPHSRRTISAPRANPRRNRRPCCGARAAGPRAACPPRLRAFLLLLAMLFQQFPPHASRWCVRCDFRLSWVRERQSLTFLLFFVFFLLLLGLASDVHCACSSTTVAAAAGLMVSSAEAFAPSAFMGSV